jgi:hypothetical protein
VSSNGWLSLLASFAILSLAVQERGACCHDPAYDWHAVSQVVPHVESPSFKDPSLISACTAS